VSFPVFLVVAGPAAKDITGRAGAIGVLSFLYFAAAAAGAFAIGRWMDRAGRRPGLVLAAILTGVGGAMAAAAIAADSFVFLLASAIPFGIGNGGSNLMRGAVADMHEPARRGRAMGVLLAVGTIGAVGSPLLVAALQGWAEGAGRDPMVVPWIIVPIGAIAAVISLSAVRPDPRDLAYVDPDVPPVTEPARTPRQLLTVSAIRIAVLAAAVGQMVMVGVMSVTPTALHDHGHGGGAISFIISAHITGMFAFGPFVGAAMDRWGRRSGLIAGFLLSITGALTAASEASAFAVGVGLMLIGIGWSATYLGATALISDATAPHERGGALGFTDLVVSAMSAIAGLAGGLLLDGAGYGWLGVVMAGVAGVVLILVARLREPAPALSRA
jgi:MFS family permease